jgi:hypothetical protein
MFVLYCHERERAVIIRNRSELEEEEEEEKKERAWKNEFA